MWITLNNFWNSIILTFTLYSLTVCCFLFLNRLPQLVCQRFRYFPTPRCYRGNSSSRYRWWQPGVPSVIFSTAVRSPWKGMPQSNVRIPVDPCASSLRCHPPPTYPRRIPKVRWTSPWNQLGANQLGKQHKECCWPGLISSSNS